MKTSQLAILTLLLILGVSDFLSAQTLLTFPTIPGRTPSDKYTCRVRQMGSNTWHDAFVLQTISYPRVEYGDGTHNGYVDILTNWTASWATFEFSGTAVEVEISKVNGEAITKAMVRPVGFASAATIVNGKAYLTFNQPANVNVDIDGQMEDQYTGMGYSGPPVHSICIFANPVFKKPTTTNPRVHYLNPGDIVPDNTTWDTLVFQPGVHNIGVPYTISSNKVLHIPGDAVVHGTIHTTNLFGANATKNYSVYGSGTLSGENIARGTANDKMVDGAAQSTRLEGFVVADPPHHTFNFTNTNFGDTTQANIYKNLKILAWRVNSDGINAFRNSVITDCFFRCQDDHFYYGGDYVKISDCTHWSDFNGAVLYVTKGATEMHRAYFKDIRVIYHRASWHYWEGGRVISFRDRQPGNVIKNVQIRNVLVEDPFPAFPPFYLKMINPNNSSALVDYSNIVIENVRQDYEGVSRSQDNNFGKPRNTMLGLDSMRMFENITFVDCSYNNVCLSSFADGNFLVNNFNRNITFSCALLPLDLLSFSGYAADKGNYLIWETANEVNASHFEIQRSFNGSAFEQIGEVACRNTMGQNIYDFTDANAAQNSIAYYRLKQIDLDGQFTYSNIVAVQSKAFSEDEVFIYPNPSSDVIFVNCPHGFEIYNTIGQLMKKSTQETGRIDVSDLEKGMYFLRTKGQVAQFTK